MLDIKTHLRLQARVDRAIRRWLVNHTWDTMESRLALQRVVNAAILSFSW